MTWLVPSEQTCLRDRDILVTLVRGPVSLPREFSHVPSQHTIILFDLKLGPSLAILGFISAEMVVSRIRVAKLAKSLDYTCAINL